MIRVNAEFADAGAGDILPLVHRFLKIYGTRLGYASADLAPEAAQQLLDYPWPGNIRELETTVPFSSAPRAQETEHLTI
ncbi:MAG TPA: hypothetical protein VLL94_12455 [Nitrospiraceae bacterium]|nr:hypothetical protein [Nitrospiraceae bacterium]